MKLPFPFLQNKKEEASEYYLALLLTDEKASAVILQETVGKLKVLNKHEEFFPSSLETSNLEDLISLVDKTISKAEEVLPPDIETHKTVFGVKDTWVEEDTKKITKDNLAKLKKVCDALDLTPIGFMVVTEAISHLLQEEEGAPLSAILAEIGKKSITLTLLRGGKAAERIDGPIDGSTATTVDNLLKHFSATVLPARIIVYDAIEAEKLSQQFIGHQWSKSLPFLHVPQVVALPAGFDAKAVTYGAAEQMGFEVMGLNTIPKTHPPVATEEIKEPNETKDEPEEKNEEKEEDETPLRPAEQAEEQAENETVITGDNFGFVMDQDITTTTPPPMPKEHGHHKTGESETTESSDFVPHITHRETDEEITSDNLELTSKPNPLSFLSALRLPKLALPALSGNRKFILPIAILVGLLILIGGLTYYYVNNVQAHIVLSVTPKMVNQDATITFSGTSGSDFSKNIIAAKTVDTSVDGSLTIDTTGKKDIGDKAKGTVTVYNNDNNSVTLSSGTSIKSSNGLIFLTDKSISIASASGDIFSGTKPGTTDVAVTARDIGTESNLPSGTKFTIGSNSSLAAKNDSAFSGGTKKQVQVVSKNDVAKLRADLPKNLESKAKDAISQKADGGMTILPLMSVVSINKPKFDNDIDDQAKKVTLTASVDFSALAYDNDELNNFAKSMLKDKFSQDISNNSIKNTISDPKAIKDDQVSAKLAIEAGLLPDIDTKDVVDKVENLSLKEAQAFLNGLPQVAQSQINFAPAIPLIPNLYPHLPKHVSIEVKSN